MSLNRSRDTIAASEVIIVGAGPGGATLAYLLARRGIHVVLLERQTDFAREFRGEVLMPGGLEPFRQMELWDALNQVPHVTLRAVALYLNGKLSARGELEESVFGELRPRWTSQPELLEMLVARSTQFPGFRFERGVSVRDLIEEGGRTAGVLTSDSREIRASLVIGADGRTSIVRRRSELEVDADPIPMDVVWCKLPLAPCFENDPHMRAYIGGGHLLITAPEPSGHMQIAWIIAKGSYGEIREGGMPMHLERMAAHVSPDLAAHFRRHRNDAIHPFFLSTVSDRVASWSRPGMLLIGDAAHTMSPVGAQGLNIAIRDAVVAANHLVPAFEDGGMPERLDEAATRIEDERVPEVAYIQRLQARPPRIILSNAWWSRILLKAAPLLLGLRGGRARAGLLSSAFAFGVSDVRLEV